MQWKTSITKIENDEAIVRSTLLTELAQKHSFVGNAYCVLTGKQPTESVERLLNVALSLSVDHGVGPVSTLAMRIGTSADISLQQSLIIAIASMGHGHGAAAEDAATWLQDNVAKNVSAEEAVRSATASGKRIPGFGHSVLAKDHRAELLLDEARRLDLFGPHAQFAAEVAGEIEAQKKKAVPLNIDGAFAAVVLDLGLPPYCATGLFILGRLPGLLAHVGEERGQKNGLRRLPEDEIEYRSS
jgi:citrate synthase